jgi:Ca2+-binding RTX toxin-like protein
MRRIGLLLATMALAVLLASGVALAAINTIHCKTDKVCFGTKARDLMKGTSGHNEMYGKGKADVLYGFRRGDSLFGGNGNDRLVGGRGIDGLYSGHSGPRDGLGDGDDSLEGGKGSDAYVFLQPGWENDIILDTEIPDENMNTGNRVTTFRDYADTAALTINLNSDSGPVPEMTNGTDTLNWSGNVIDNVSNASGGTNDQIVGNDAANHIFSVSNASPVEGEEGTTDADTIDARGGNDLIVVRGDDGTDTVECGAGTDTVVFDVGEDVLLNPEACETKNPW